MDISIYTSTSKFSAHIKTKKHQKWLESLNYNKANFYVDLLKSQETINNQQKIIKEMEIKLQNKNIFSYNSKNNKKFLYIKTLNKLIKNNKKYFSY